MQHLVGDQLTAILRGRVVLSLTLLDRSKVIDEDESTLVLWVDIPLGALIARTQIALLHVLAIRSRSLGRGNELWGHKMAAGFRWALPAAPAMAAASYVAK